jgi:hypothetical protein
MYKPQRLVLLEGSVKVMKIDHLVGSQTCELPACSMSDTKRF